MHQLKLSGISGHYVSIHIRSQDGIQGHVAYQTKKSYQIRVKLGEQEFSRL